ncbi:sensor histidine kinase [Virgibacillus sp. W0181]|uniref:sensor histidine kinase n=1 Tax=Virgibacillus sp. W0181 TaxID=3391581 RepID=UPI003F48D3F8
MKLFMKEHIGFIALQCMQLLFISMILILSGFHEYAILLYCVVISFFLLFVYLIFHYYNRRHMYKKLSISSIDLQQLLERTDNTPIGEALDQLTKTQYQLFMNHLKEAEDDQANHLKFINRWVHQMKTPLSVIELSAQELDEPESSNIREETGRIKNGLNTVLYMARMRTIQEDFQIKPVELKKIIQAVNQENKRFYIRNEVYPRVTIKSNLTVETDEKWLFFIIDQLLHNAVKYTAGRSNRIDITVYKRAEAAVLEITDYGVGIPVHDKKRVFQAFYTGDNGRTFRESTGIGLYLTKEVIDYLGHTIEVASTVDKGTTFRICFTKPQTLA